MEIDASVIGLVAALLTTTSFLPQIIKVLRTKKTSGISLGMYGLFVAGTFSWVLHGVNNNDYPLIVANGLTFLFALVILFFKLKEVKQK